MTVVDRLPVVCSSQKAWVNGQRQYGWLLLVIFLLLVSLVVDWFLSGVSQVAWRGLLLWAVCGWQWHLLQRLQVPHVSSHFSVITCSDMEVRRR